MKKIIIVLNLVLLSLIVSGCGCSKKEEKTIVCKMSKTFDNYSFEAEYILKYFEDESVKQVIEQATFNSNDSETLESIKTLNASEYGNYSELKWSKYDANIDGDNLKIYLEINFDKMNMEDFISVYDSNLYYVVDGKINYKKYIEEYEKDGFDCN